MKKIEIEIPEGKKAEWVNGVLTLVDEKPIEYKFKVGDKVKIKVPNKPQYGEITELGEYDGKPLYTLKSQDAVFDVYERYLEPLPKPITERIKTLDDAVEWCSENGHGGLVLEYNVCAFQLGEISTSSDLLAYLALRIITCALNEGLEPTVQDNGWYASASHNNFGHCMRTEFITGVFGIKLTLKSAELAKYAAIQFRDIYADFCGCKKGGEE